MMILSLNNTFAIFRWGHASVKDIPKFVQASTARFLHEKELQSYYDSVGNSKRPLVAIIVNPKEPNTLAVLEDMIIFFMN